MKCLGTRSLHLQKSCASGVQPVLLLEQPQSRLLVLQCLPLEKQAKHVTAQCGGLPVTQDCELSEEAFLGFQNCFCNSDLAFFPHFFFKGVDMLYALPILFATHLYLIMMRGVHLNMKIHFSLQPWPTTTASCFYPCEKKTQKWPCTDQPSSARLGQRLPWKGLQGGRGQRDR